MSREVVVTWGWVVAAGVNAEAVERTAAAVRMANFIILQLINIGLVMFRRVLEIVYLMRTEEVLQ